MLALIFLFYFLLLVATVVISSFYFIYWFYKNLFTDEGYLMHTIPAPSWMHITSKTVGMILWQVIDLAVVVVCIFMLLFSFREFAEAFPQMMKYLSVFFTYYMDLEAWGAIALSVLIFLLSIIVHGLSAFMCIAIGQLFNRHRILAAFIAYIILSIAVSFISSFIMIAVGYDTMGSDTYLRFSYLSELFSSLVLSVIYFIVTNYLISRRLNLE